MWAIELECIGGPWDGRKIPRDTGATVLVTGLVAQHADGFYRLAPWIDPKSGTVSRVLRWTQLK